MDEHRQNRMNHQDERMLKQFLQ